LEEENLDAPHDRRVAHPALQKCENQLRLYTRQTSGPYWYVSAKMPAKPF